MRTLSIDIETYSSADIRSVGMYKYVEAPDFAVLMLAYAFDNEPVRIVDIASGEDLPIEVEDALLYDHTVRLCAHNAAFERTCLNKHLGANIAPERWHCTMVHAAMLGLPMKLETVAKVLKMEQQKDTEGKKLIDFFSKPHKPKTAHFESREYLYRLVSTYPQQWDQFREENDIPEWETDEMCYYPVLFAKQWLAFRKKLTSDGLSLPTIRNYPDDDREKWVKFKNYCVQDVVVERDIRRSIEWFEIPAIEREVWCEDQRISDRGVALDLPFIHQVITVDNEYKADLTREAAELTGLENPNSVTQLSQWLTEATGDEVESLRKDDIKDMLERADQDAVRRILEIRQLTSKTSTAKYHAMLACVCADGRARGLLQYYGANRTGRAAGRLIQVQNLPRISTDTIDVAREIFVNGEIDLMECLYYEVPNMLSQFIRTAFVAAPGKRFIVVDFSAIEARVIAWLANEEWRLEVFRTHGKIYEASASQMFKVPIETIKKGHDNYALRQKGKVAELACIAKGELVLTDKGLVPIENVTTNHLLWDGYQWVSHEGVISKGIKNVITYDGLTATEDHLVYTEGQDFPIQFGHAAARNENLVQSGFGGETIWLGEDHKPRKKVHEGLASSDGVNSVHGLPKSAVDKLQQPHTWEIKRVPGLFTTSTSTEVAGQETNIGEKSLRKSERSWVPKLRRAGHKVQLFFGIGSRGLDNRKHRVSGQGDGVGQKRQQRSLRAWEPTLGNTAHEQEKPKTNSTTCVGRYGLAVLQDCGRTVLEAGNDARTNTGHVKSSRTEQAKELERHSREVEVFDIVNAGPNHRFTVSDRLVHNCGYGGGPGALEAMGALKMGLKQEELQPIIRAWRDANPAITRLWRNVQDAAIRAVETGQRLALKPGLKFYVKNSVLFVKLPSGRRLAYQRPTLREGQYGNELVYEEVVRTSAAGWGKEKTYGGKLVENITQAVARDCLMHAMLRVIKAGYEVVIHVHDELVLEAPEGFGSLEEVERIMTEPLPWAPGLPLGADGFESKYYKK